MKKNLSIIYQFLLSIRIPNSYLVTILLTNFILSVHIFLIKDIIRLSLKMNYLNWTKMILGISIFVAIFILIFFKKEKLLELKYPNEDLRQKIVLRFEYFSLVLLSSLILSFIK